MPLTDVMGSDDPFPGHDVGRPVELSGDVARRRLLGRGPRRWATEPGYWAVAPLQVGDAARARRTRLGARARPRRCSPRPGAADVTGWLQAPEGSLVTDDDPSDDVFPEIRVADAVQRVDVDLYSAYAVEPGARRRAARPRSSRRCRARAASTGVRNLLYAVEWWIFGAFAAFIWWRWRRDATAPEVAPLDATGRPDRLAAVSRNLTAYRVMATDRRRPARGA